MKFMLAHAVDANAGIPYIASLLKISPVTFVVAGGVYTCIHIRATIVGTVCAQLALSLLAIAKFVV